MTKQKLSLRHSAAFRELSQPSSNGLSHLFSVTKRKKTLSLLVLSLKQTFEEEPSLYQISLRVLPRTPERWKGHSSDESRALWRPAGSVHSEKKDMKCGMCQRFSSPSPYFFEQCVAVLWLLSRGGPPSYLTAVGCTRGSRPLSGSQRLLSQSEAASELISDSLTS